MRAAEQKFISIISIISIIFIIFIISIISIRINYLVIYYIQ
jgi:hypothetical protein